MVQVTVRKVSKIFEGFDRLQALSDISLTAADGEFLVLLGPSGSGKTTLLRSIAGLETVNSGDIEFGDRRVNDLDPGRRNIGMVFQDYALYPHLTVRGNIAYNMKLRRIPRDEIDRRISEVAVMLGIERLLDRRPAELSGGQRQRVAVARAITRDASVLLMDEPLSNLDAQIREHVRVELKELQRRLGVTTIYVTHDQVEAMVIADRIAVMTEGKVEQIGSPEEIYDHPATLFCARFVGSPKINEICGEMKMLGDRTAEILVKPEMGETATLRIDCDEPLSERSVAGNIIVAFRPEDCRILDGAAGALPAKVALIENRGAEKYVVAELPSALRGAQISADLRFRLDSADAKAGQPLFFAPGRCHLFLRGSQQRIASGRCLQSQLDGATKPGRSAAAR
jgi:ABC-type sugar transport system ATPase subunit